MASESPFNKEMNFFPIDNDGRITHLDSDLNCTDNGIQKDFKERVLPKSKKLLLGYVSLLLIFRKKCIFFFI